MAAKDPEPAAPEAQQSTSASTKRKSALAQIEVDLSLPEPPSKKARRLLKKGKVLPAKPASSGGEDGKSSDDGKDGKGKQAKRERSPHGVWIGNLPFTVTKADLRKWLVDNSGGSIADDAITRVHMPTTKKPASASTKAATENRGFAYVDFASFEANVAAIALSETELGGRKLLIKDSKSFEGRPNKEEEEPEPSADAAAESHGNKKPVNSTGTSSSSSTKIFVGNLSFSTTEDDLHAHFSRCGKIRWIKVATFEDSGKCKGYGWVNFEEPDAAAWAVKGFVKVRETVETLEDFMDEGGEGSDSKGAEAAEQDNEHDDASKASDSDERNEDNDSDSKPATIKDQAKPKPKATTTPPARNRTRTRKWWVNQLLGRTLKIELAEDDQTRYHKRFGKGAAKQQQQKQQQQHNSRKGGDAEVRSKAPEDDQDTTTRKRTKSKDREKDGQGGAINHATDISIARRTGAAVAPLGRKITFD